MKIMLISPPNILEGNIKEESSFDNRTTPLDLAIIGAILEKNHKVKILDALAFELNKEQILKEIDNFNPDLVCLTAFDRCRWALDSANELSKSIADKKIGLIWSYEARLMIKLMENNPLIDFSIYGDPEFALIEVVNNIEKNKSLKNIKGLIYREKKKIIQNKPRELIKNIDELPFPDRNLLDLGSYKRLPHELIKEPNFDMIVSRGCPYNCSFCLMKIVGGKIRRQRSPERTIEEMKLLKEKGAKQIHFQDLTFTMDKSWTKRFCTLLIKEKLKLIWTCQTRTDRVDFKLLKLMRRAGCRSILYGVESFNQNSLNQINKKINKEDVAKIIKLTKKLKIEARCSMMIGLPGETKASVLQTIHFLNKLNPAFVQFHTTMAFPGTELYENANKYGRIVKNKIAKKFDISGMPFVPNSYKDEEDVLETQKKAYRIFYFRLGYIISKIFNIKQFSRNLRGIKIFLKLLKR